MRGGEVSISVVKCSWVKFGEVLQSSDGPSNKVSNNIRRYTDNMKLLLIYSLVLFFINVYMVVFLFSTVIYVFLLLCLCILIVCLMIFIVPAGTLRLPWLRFFRAFFSAVRQMPGSNPQRWGTARTNLPIFFVLFYVLFVSCVLFVCKCVQHYCHRVATQLQLNISYHSYHIMSCILLSAFVCWYIDGMQVWAF
jgi:hypothetical protein